MSEREKWSVVVVIVVVDTRTRRIEKLLLEDIISEGNQLDNRIKSS